MISRQRARAYPVPSRLVKGVAYDVICKLSAVTAIVSLVNVFRHRSNPDDLFSGHLGWGVTFLASVLVYALFSVVRHYHGRRTRCPLCHGTLFHEQRSQKHKEATKFRFLNYHASTVLSLLLTGQCRCMYCGTAFRLKR
jgi:hypothetical protein